MSEAKLPDTVEVFYQKANSFRVIHADGAFGGGSPRGLLNIAFYNERSALPQRSQIPLVDGLPQAEHIIETKGGIIREIEVNVVMDISSALVFHAWLGQRIDEIIKQVGMTDDQKRQIMGGGK